MQDSRVKYHTFINPDNKKKLQLQFDLNDLRAEDDLEPELEVKVIFGEIVVKGSCIEKEKSASSGRLFTCSWHNVKYYCPLPKVRFPVATIYL